MNPNYDDHDDFHSEDEDRAKRFLEKVFGPEDTNPCVIRNTECKFTDKVLDYICHEWMVDVIHYSHEVQHKAMDMIDFMKAKGENVPNTASKIAMEVLPLI